MWDKNNKNKQLNNYNNDINKYNNGDHKSIRNSDNDKNKKLNSR